MRRDTEDEPSLEALSSGDEWPFHYRGYGLSINTSGEVWWQAYNGTDRLALEPAPSKLVDAFLKIKGSGGSLRVTEGGSVITKREKEDGSGEYETIYVGHLNLNGRLVPPEKPEHAIEISPDDPEPGDLWRSIYDGARYSFNGDRFWWHNSETKLRHKFVDQLPWEITDQLNRLRRTGGRFVVTPSGDVVTQIPPEQTPEDVRSQFQDLPRPVKRFLQLRRNRGNVEKVPVYVGHLPSTHRPIDVEDPTRLTDPLSETEHESLEKWISSMGDYEEDSLSEDRHRVDSDEEGEE